MSENPSHPLFAAVYDRLMRTAEEELFPRHREYLVDGIEGRLLDIGSGTGAMFPYFRERIEAGADLELHGIEPDPHMLRRAEREAAAVGIDIDLRETGAESLPYPDDHFDHVTAGLVFCTIPDPAVALDEVARVLRPDGEFRFLEHVRDEGWRARLQSVVEPVWERAAAGCQLTRTTSALFADHDAFELVDLERHTMGVTPVRPFVRGTLRRVE